MCTCCIRKAFSSSSRRSQSPPSLPSVKLTGDGPTAEISGRGERVGRRVLLPSTPSSSSAAPGSSSQASRLREATTFHKYGFCRELHLAISNLGLATPTQVQDLAIPKVLAGRNAVILGQTGTGKTLAYLLPIVEMLMRADTEQLYPLQGGRPRCLVLVPTRELANQIFAQLVSLPITSLLCAAGHSYVKEVRALRSGVDVLVATPARFLLHVIKGNVRTNRLRFLVLDEADMLCGDLFEEETLRIMGMVKGIGLSTAVGDPKVPEGEEEGEREAASSPLAGLRMRLEKDTRWGLGAESAVLRGDTREETATRRAAQLIMVSATRTGALKSFLHTRLTQDLSEVVSPDAHLTVPSLHQVFLPLQGKNRMHRLFEALEAKESTGGRTMIFCNAVDTVRAVDFALSDRGHKVSQLHAKMPFKTRSKKFWDFKNGKTDILVCTNVASRGLEIPR
eukprot:Cvel_22536.t1-p1 / transcript=Cvel_22536.t1 / gene=Cvel_22536 / organism=Chromera_velia_CCMP2878 / gene_product=DEAD-box ATP-dependent RNA helicase 39, putative / transcript_product=DEAD-box ATP-dependent RNA helicase 39, putative / location=Cvel_scaffold2225:456-3229(-) / protein_length=450 / sequence_SO=supercontig / SO=protein_coding / is_pseudo=false